MSERERADSLCASCVWMRTIVSGRGSQFLLCRKSQDDPRFAKYPPQPVIRCLAYARGNEAENPNRPAT